MVLADKQQEPMEVQQQMPRNLLIHSPYDIVKQEPAASPDSSRSYSQSDLLFGTQFHLNSFMPTNNNHETHNHNHSRNCAKGRTLTADRKRPYPCTICPSRFGSKMELEEHQNSHTGQKPFECDVCNARFNRRSTLWNHKRIHSDAKPFVCTVCQMTFKWKNSLKCHKEMHLRKNESSTVLDNDLRQLTYATAAKRRLMQESEEGGNVVNSSTPLITTTSPKKRPNKTQSNGSQSNQSQHTNNDLDQASLDSLVQPANGNILVQLCGDMDPTLGRHNILSSIEDTSALLSPHMFSDIKSELLYPPSLSAQSPHGHMNNINVNVQIPIVGNMLNFRGLNSLTGHPQQLPSVHHLTSTASLPSVQVQMEYQSDLSHPQYIVTTQPDMMISQPTITSYQQNLDHCVVISAQDYMPNYDFSVIGGGGGSYMSGDSAENTPQMNGDSQSQTPSGLSDSGKVVPYDRW